MAATIAATTVATSMPALAAFDANYYAKQNPDVVAAVGTTPKALENHYNTFGKKEGRAASAEDLANSPLRQIFDAKLYAQLYPDVVAVFGTDANALFQHFMTFGINEGRKINQYFDVNAYKAAYPDLAKAFGDNTAMYYHHFVTFGIKEHRTLGGFPAENILPGGVKKATASASSGGSSGGSGGGSASSGGSSSGAVTPGAGLPTNVAATPAAVASANAAVKSALGDYYTASVDENTGEVTYTAKQNATISKEDKDALVASAQSTYQAAKAVNTAAQANLATAVAEKKAADKALATAEEAVENSKTEGVKTFVGTQTQVKAVADAQKTYYDNLGKLDDAKEVQAEAAKALTEAQATAKTAKANYETAVKNAKDTYVAVSGNPASYIAEKDDNQIMTALNELAGGNTNTTVTSADKKTATNNKSVGAGTETVKPIIGKDGTVSKANYEAAIEKATADAEATVLEAYQLAYINSKITALEASDFENNKLTDAGKEKLAGLGLTDSQLASITNNTSNLSTLVADNKKAVTSTVIGNYKPSSGDYKDKTLAESQEAKVETDTKAIDTLIDQYTAALSREDLYSSIQTYEAADTALNGNNGAVKAKAAADEGVKKAEKDVSDASTAITAAEEARDEAYAKAEVSGNAELATRDTAQAIAAKEAYDESVANKAASEAELNQTNAKNAYNAATEIKVTDTAN